MALKPIVRYMILCEDWDADPEDPLCVNILGLLSNVRSLEMPPYPLYRDLCVFLVLTEGRGVGEGQIICVFEETDQKVFATPKHKIAFGSDPLDVVGVPFQIRHCPFPEPGIYLVQFWYNDEKLDERPLRLR
jgi:uncharacterized protein DUF6941